MTCSTSEAPDAPADVPPVLTPPIPDEIDRNVTIGTAGSRCWQCRRRGCADDAGSQYEERKS